MAKQRSKIWIYFSKNSKDKGLCNKGAFTRNHSAALLSSAAVGKT
jgi:hypothetical protein